MRLKKTQDKKKEKKAEEAEIAAANANKGNANQPDGMERTDEVIPDFKDFDEDSEGDDDIFV